MRKYAIIIERAEDGGFGAYAPDLPGCVGMGSSKEAAVTSMVESIQFHLEGMIKEGLQIPEPKSEAENLVFAI